MPGTKDAKASPAWFKKAFGFRESSFESTKKLFNFDDGTLQINGQDNKCFHVGPFDLLSLEELRARLASNEGSDSLLENSRPLTFHNIRATTCDLHLAPENAGAVFQVASLFNCLELDAPDSSPTDSITDMGCQSTQGSACASACPAATVFRALFANGDGPQIDCLSEVAQIVNNRRQKYWTMRNGFCMPSKDFKKINARFQEDIGYAEDIRKKLKVGIHWDTEVFGGDHRVAQVLCSAAPVSLGKCVKTDDWETFARTLLEAQFEATLTAAACLARDRGERVKVYLTPVGGGLLGNRVKWIAAALDRALTLLEAAPLDVHLVHMERPNQKYKDLETPSRWDSAPRAARTITQHMRRLSVELDSCQEKGQAKREDDADTENARRIARAFSFFDLNGDGVIDRREFMEILLMLDSYFFSMETVDKLLKDADADGDGEVHYVEFATWLAGAPCDAVIRNLFQASLAAVDEGDFAIRRVEDDLEVEPLSDQELQSRITEQAETRRSSLEKKKARQ